MIIVQRDSAPLVLAENETSYPFGVVRLTAFCVSGCHSFSLHHILVVESNIIRQLQRDSAPLDIWNATFQSTISSVLQLISYQPNALPKHVLH